MPEFTPKRLVIRIYMRRNMLKAKSRVSSCKDIRQSQSEIKREKVVQSNILPTVILKHFSEHTLSHRVVRINERKVMKVFVSHAIFWKKTYIKIENIKLLKSYILQLEID